MFYSCKSNTSLKKHPTQAKNSRSKQKFFLYEKFKVVEIFWPIAKCSILLFIWVLDLKEEKLISAN